MCFRVSTYRSDAPVHGNVHGNACFRTPAPRVKIKFRTQLIDQPLSDIPIETAFRPKIPWASKSVDSSRKSRFLSDEAHVALHTRMRGAPPSRSRVSSSRRAIDDVDDDRAPPPTLAERERASFATLRATHLDAVDAMVRQLDALSDEEARAREAFEAEWDARLADFRARRDALESKMRDRHRDALEATRETLERALAGAPSRWSPQLEEMRRSRKALVRHKRFGEALDLLQRISDKETEEMEAHRERVRAENARALERAFERHREERAVLAREADAEEERLKARRAKALRAATREWGRRAEEEAARRLVSLAAGHQSPFRNGAANRARPKSKSKSKTNDRDDDGDDGRFDDAAARAYGLGARRLGSPRGISNGADSNAASDRSPRPTRLPPGAYANADVLWRRSGTRKPESPEPPGSPSPGEYASIRSPCAAVHRSERSERSERASARGTSPGGSSEVFSPAHSDASAARAFYQNLGGGADMLRLSYSARGDDALSTRDAIPSLDAIPTRGGDAWISTRDAIPSRDGISTRDGIPAEDADASRRLSESSRGAGADVVHPPVIGSIPAGSRFDPALQHMVSLEQRRAWEEMRRRRAMMDEAHAAWIARARSDASTPGTYPPGVEPPRPRASPAPPHHPGRPSPPPAVGASGASARQAADNLMAAAMAMAGTSNRPPPSSTADRKREEERVADARRRAMAGDASESESDVDDDELDDIDLVARTPARLRDGDSNRRAPSEGSGGGAEGFRRGFGKGFGPALDLRGIARANENESSPPRAPRGIGAVVGGVGASAAARAVPRVRAGEREQPSDSRTRGVAADRARAGRARSAPRFPTRGERRGAAPEDARTGGRVQEQTRDGSERESRRVGFPGIAPREGGEGCGGGTGTGSLGRGRAFGECGGGTGTGSLGTGTGMGVLPLAPRANDDDDGAAEPFAETIRSRSDRVRRGARRDVERSQRNSASASSEVRSRGGDEKRRGSLGRRSRGRRVDARGAARRRRRPSPRRGI